MSEDVFIIKLQVLKVFILNASKASVFSSEKIFWGPFAQPPPPPHLGIRGLNSVNNVELYGPTFINVERFELLNL